MLLSIKVHPQIAGSHICIPLFLAAQVTNPSAYLAWRRLDTSLKSNQLRPSGARNIRREERLHGSAAIGGRFYPTQFQGRNASVNLSLA